MQIIPSKLILPFSFFSLFLCATPAWADQCSYISQTQAIKAVDNLKLDEVIYTLCEPCGETTPVPVTITSLSIGTTGYEDFWEIKVNGSGIDAAYTFVSSGIQGKFVNLAAIIDCQAQDVSPFLP